MKIGQNGIECLAISSDGEMLVSGRKGGTVQRWGGRTGQAVGEPLQGHNGSTTRIVGSENGNRIVSYSTEGDVRLWDALSGEAVGIPLRGYRADVTCIAITRDGKLVMSSSMDENVRHWDVSAERNGTENHQLLTSWYEDGLNPFLRRIVSFSVCGNGKIAVYGSSDGIVQIWDVLNREAVGGPMLEHACIFGELPVAISRDGTLIVSSGGDCMVRRWNASTGEAIGEPMDGHSKEVSAIVTSDDGKHIFTGCEDGIVRRWDAKTGDEFGKPMKHSGGDIVGIVDLVISTDGKLIVLGTYGSLERWDTRTGEQIGDYIEVPGHAEILLTSSEGKALENARSKNNVHSRVL